MAIQVGDRIPDLSLKTMRDGSIEEVKTADFFGGRKVVLFAVPGAFTPTCSAKHLPGFVEKADAIKAKGVDEIACVSVNDVFVMGAWADAQGSGDKVTLLADGSGDLARAIDLEFDGTNFGMGMRCQRFAAIVDDGEVTLLNVEAPAKFEVSDADTILAAL